MLNMVWMEPQVEMTKAKAAWAPMSCWGHITQQCLHIWNLACGYGSKSEAFRSWKLMFFGAARFRVGPVLSREQDGG